MMPFQIHCANTAFSYCFPSLPHSCNYSFHISVRQSLLKLSLIFYGFQLCSLSLLSKLPLSFSLRWSVMRRRCVARSVMPSRTSTVSGKDLSIKLYMMGKYGGDRFLFYQRKSCHLKISIFALLCIFALLLYICINSLICWWSNIFILQQASEEDCLTFVNWLT